MSDDPARSLSGLRILVLDQDRSRGDALSALLREAGAEAGTVPEGVEPAVVIAEAVPDGIVIDRASPALDPIKLRATLELAVSDGLNAASIARIPRAEAAELLVDLRNQLDTLRGLVEQFETRIALAEPTDEAPLPAKLADGDQPPGRSNSGVTNSDWAS